MADNPGHNISRANAKQMREFFSLYGSFLQLWQSFELVIEIGIMRQLNLSARHASIVLNSLNFSAKSSILLALLKEDAEKNKVAISAITETQTERFCPPELIRRLIPPRLGGFLAHRQNISLLEGLCECGRRGNMFRGK
jgi:hypothetical protein